MSIFANKNTRRAIIKKLDSGKIKYVGMLESVDSDLHCFSLGKLFLIGTACDAGIIPDWQRSLKCESSDVDSQISEWIDKYHNILLSQ